MKKVSIGIAIPSHRRRFGRDQGAADKNADCISKIVLSTARNGFLSRCTRGEVAGETHVDRLDRGSSRRGGRTGNRRDRARNQFRVRRDREQRRFVGEIGYFCRGSATSLA